MLTHTLMPDAPTLTGRGKAQRGVAHSPVFEDPAISRVNFLRRFFWRPSLLAGEVDDSLLAEGVEALLQPREAAVLVFAWSGCRYRQIGLAVGVSRERARQIEAKAMRRLQYRPVWRRLRVYLPGWHNVLRHACDQPWDWLEEGGR